jgi:hypothetical protein
MKVKAVKLCPVVIVPRPAVKMNQQRPSRAHTFRFDTICKSLINTVKLPNLEHETKLEAVY